MQIKYKNIFYNNINNLLKPNVPLKITEQQIQEIYKCKHNIEYFLTTYCKVVHQHRGLVPFEPYQFQKNFIKHINENRHVIGLVGRQSGKTTCLCGYILHYVIFNNNKNVAIVANKGITARKILGTIKNMLRTLPMWLQPGTSKWEASTVTLGNNSQILASNTSADSLTGESISLLVIDECSKVDSSVWGDFYNSVFPTISSSPSSKVVMISTPYGLNHFFKLWTDAKNGNSEFKPFQVAWNEVPGRDENFRKEIIAAFNEDYFEQEFACEFMGSTDSLISMSKLKSMPMQNAKFTQYDNKLRIFEEPVENGVYYAICDYSEGIGLDDSVIQVFRKQLNIFTQVAVFNDNKIRPREFANMKFLIGEYYNNALVIGENNSIGMESLNELFEELEYDNIFWDFDNKNKIGFRQDKKRKKLGCTYLKKMVENDKLIIVDYETIKQLSTFVKKRDSFAADSECHDDLVTPLVIFSYLLNHTLFVDNYVDKYEMRHIDQSMDRDDILPCYFSTNNTYINMTDD